MKKKVVVGIIIIILAASITLTGTAFLVAYLTNITSFKLSDVTFMDYRVWSIWVALILGALVVYISNYKMRVGKSVLKANKELEDSHFLTKQEMLKNKNLVVTKLSKLSGCEDGIPILAEKKRRDINIVIGKAIHTLVIGTTGSGKTSGFVDPVMEIMSRTKTKPSMIITDPKGELYLHHAESLKKNGYETPIIDLDDIYRSVHWNPFNEIWQKTDRITNAKVEQVKGKYYFDGAEYLCHADAEKECKVLVQQLNDEIYLDLQDLIYTICPIENKHDSTWQKGARDLIFAIALGFWEDVRDGLMTRKQFNLFNIYENISKYCVGEMTEIKAFFENRDKFSKTTGLSNTVLVSQDKTLTSYMGDINQYFSWMADSGISSLTSSNEIEFSKFDEKPTALFLKIPDEKENRHKLITLFITQMYKALVTKAADNQKKGLTKEAKLLRNAYFIMDEFGNMPKFYNIDKIITVGRSRGIFMIPIIQDFNQLDNKYGKEIAAIIKSNCNIQIFIGSNDIGTLEEFSKQCGKQKVNRVSFSENKDVSISSSAEEKPLINLSELKLLNDPPQRMGNAIVLAFGKHPLRSIYTPVFKAKDIYNITDTLPSKPTASLFEAADYFYDITKRNNFLKELSSLEAEAEDFTADLLSQLKMIDGVNAYEDSDEAVANEVQRIYLSIEKKLLKLKGRISNEDFNSLMKIDIVSRIKFLNSLIDSASEKRDNFLMFDLASVKNFIERTCTSQSAYDISSL